MRLTLLQTFYSLILTGSRKSLLFNSPDLHTLRPMAHVFSQQEIVQGISANKVEQLQRKRRYKNVNYYQINIYRPLVLKLQDDIWKCLSNTVPVWRFAWLAQDRRHVHSVPAWNYSTAKWKHIFNIFQTFQQFFFFNLKYVGCEFKLHWVTFSRSTLTTSTRINIKVIDGNVKMFGCNKHPLTMSTFFCIFSLIVRQTQCIIAAGNAFNWFVHPPLVLVQVLSRGRRVFPNPAKVLLHQVPSNQVLPGGGEREYPGSGLCLGYPIPQDRDLTRDRTRVCCLPGGTSLGSSRRTSLLVIFLLISQRNENRYAPLWWGCRAPAPCRPSGRSSTWFSLSYPTVSPQPTAQRSPRVQV